MNYTRPKYRDPAVKTETAVAPYSALSVSIPIFETEITPRENFRRSITRDNPLWMPNCITDKITIGANDIISHHVRGMQVHSDFLRPTDVDYEFKDWFNTDWTWVASAGGAMLTPGTQLIDDITRWEKEVVFPDLTEWGFEEKAADFMKNNYDPAKALSYDIGRGMTERLVSIMGGYEASMESLLIEPEAVSDFFSAYADFMIRYFDAVNNLYPLDFVTIHDDWGTERDTFFSEKVMEDLVFEPTKKLIDHIKSKGVFLEMHACGNITRFFPYIVELNCDLAQVQRRVVDIPKMKEKYGGKIGFCVGLEGIDITKPPVTEEYIAATAGTVDMFAPGGGSYLMAVTPNEELLWDICAENYFRSNALYKAAQSST